MKFRIAVGLWALVLPLSASCGPEFAAYNEVAGFRLLAIGAEPPEWAAERDVMLSALVVGDDAPTFQWRWCPVTQGAAAEHRCAIAEDDLPDTLPSMNLGTSPQATMTWPQDLTAMQALCDLAARQPAPVEAPRLDCEADRPQVYVRLEVTSSTGHRIVGLHPLPLRTPDAPPNANPELMGIEVLDGNTNRPLEDGDTLPINSELQISLTMPNTSAESYHDGTQETRESLRATWFVAGGETDRMRTLFIPDDPGASMTDLQTNRWTLPEDPTDVSLYLVLRDSRGGTRWLERHARTDGGAP